MTEIINIRESDAGYVNSNQDESRKLTQTLKHLLEEFDKLPQSDQTARDTTCSIDVPDPVLRSADEARNQIIDTIGTEVDCYRQKAISAAQSEPRTHVLSIKDIASWQFPEWITDCSFKQPSIIAGAPSLQRGAVWDAGQVEMLWDSLFRGFPIGALVVSPKNLAIKQKIRFGRYSAGTHSPTKSVESRNFTHHLLDGQQRCNAIALGFLDPTLECNQDSPAALWLDLQSPKHSDDSTRSFWFRVLTKAHPWGYKCDDKAARLPREKFRAAMDEWHINQNKKRPKPTMVWPPEFSDKEASAPIPLQWLMHAIAFENKRGDSLWEHLATRCEANKSSWGQKTFEFILKNRGKLEPIESAVVYATGTEIVALVWAGIAGQDDTQVNQESSLLDVEQLFQRLNTQGTPLQGAELLYSMVKAYWPGIEEVMAIFDKTDGVERVVRKPVDDARLAMLGFRAARIELDTVQGQNRYPAEPSIAAIRGWAKSDGTQKQLADMEKIKKYLGLQIPPLRSNIHNNVALIDKWLLWNGIDDFGIPPVLRSEIARNAPEVYLMLLDLAENTHAKVEAMEEVQRTEWRRGLIGLATSLFWFSEKRELAVQKIGAYLASRPLNASFFNGALNVAVDSHQNSLMKNILTLDDMDEAVPKAPMIKEDLATWNLWERMVPVVEDKDNEKERNHRELVWRFFSGLVNNKSFLHFAQRDLMGTEFADYDPALTDTWAEHDRPWDVDHILADSIGKYRTDSLRAACTQWIDTLGNWRNCALEKNRSKGAGLVSQTINQEDWKSSLIKDEDADAFNMSTDDLYNEEKVAGFANAARARFLRMYKDWYETLQIARLLQSPAPDDVH